MSLFSKTINALKWSIFSTYANMALQFVVGLVLARILMPEDFGLLGMTYVFVAVATTFVDSGFLQALIQKSDATEADFSVVFKFNLIISIILALGIFLLSERIAAFYSQPKVAAITRVLSTVIFIESLSLVQKASLQKHLRFELRAKVELTAITISGGISIYLALRGFGVWSLVIRSILYSICTTLLFWLFNPIRIDIRAPWRRIRPLLNFGGKIFIADQVEGISNQLAQLIIGKKYTAQDLGFYTKAEQFQNILSNMSIISVNKVIFPSFSMIQDDNQKLKTAYQALIKGTLFFLTPLMVTCILLARHVIPLLIGEKWMEMVPYFQILCLSAIFFPFTIFNLNIIKVKGKASLYFRLALVSKGILVPAILIGLHFGVKGLVIAMLIQRIAAGIINSLYSGQLVNYGLGEQVRDVGSYFIYSGILFMGIFLFKSRVLAQMQSDLWISILLLLLMAVGYGCLVLLFSRRDIARMRRFITRAKEEGR